MVRQKSDRGRRLNLARSICLAVKSPTGGVSEAKRGRVPARFRSFPWCFQSRASVAVTGKNTLATVKRRGPQSRREWAKAGAGQSYAQTGDIYCGIGK